MAAMPRPVDTHLQKTNETEKRNVVLIHLESTRARSVTPYNEDIRDHSVSRRSGEEESLGGTGLYDFAAYLQSYHLRKLRH